ncbi:uncharacterized protein YjiS (DUF1127 family) [Rhodovulum bhavnagarense]|uniref:Uncharacterized protein YjiS (DUF1127 family) n=1 Tax=Rhodovulum bhavnagarense TaxID=992286 RepID=A0A4R2RUZ3_9RHOB|nr:DUF1127 domain-containing protein [Rhodovulum bhavnagarense]TCP62955.1 uncharacterized protein YjiS (DUF1127 family) [Rhodovulum bhavnagarense]
MAHITANIRLHAHSLLPGALPRRILAAFSVARQRRRLAELDDAMLRDIGLSRAAARAEARRPLWDVPSNWLR